jgi:hypothetical protein
MCAPRCLLSASARSTVSLVSAVAFSSHPLSSATNPSASSCAMLVVAGWAFAQDPSFARLKMSFKGRSPKEGGRPTQAAMLVHVQWAGTNICRLSQRGHRPPTSSHCLQPPAAAAAAGRPCCRSAAHAAAACRALSGSFKSSHVNHAPRFAPLTRVAPGGANPEHADEEAMLAELRSLAVGTLHDSVYIEQVTSVAFICWLAERTER